MIRSLIEHYLSTDAESFAAWAFGEEFKSYANFETTAHHYWNDRHSDKLKLDGSGRPQDDIPKMIEIWRNREIR